MYMGTPTPWSGLPEFGTKWIPVPPLGPDMWSRSLFRPSRRPRLCWRGRQWCWGRKTAAGLTTRGPGKWRRPCWPNRAPPGGDRLRRTPLARPTKLMPWWRSRFGQRTTPGRRRCSAWEKTQWGKASTMTPPPLCSGRSRRTLAATGCRPRAWSLPTSRLGHRRSPSPGTLDTCPTSSLTSVRCSQGIGSRASDHLWRVSQARRASQTRRRFRTVPGPLCPPCREVREGPGRGPGTGPCLLCQVAGWLSWQRRPAGP